MGRPLDSGNIESYLHENIPISRAMGISVAECSTDSVTLSAALEPNLNHRRTAFGGSIAALGILAGWSMLYVRLHANQPMPRIVIQRSAIDYVSAVESGFSARCCMPPAEQWLRFESTLQRRQRARIQLVAEIVADFKTAARHTGDFVVLNASDQG